MGRTCSANVTAFSLRHLVRQVLDGSTTNDPHQIAPEVLRRIDSEDLKAALRDALPAFVRETIRGSNSGVPLLPVVPPQASLNGAPGVREVMAESPGSGPLASAGRGGVKPGRSVKVAAIRACGPRWLADRINTAADPREWKRVGDCSFADLMFAAGQRREQAARTSAKAERLEALAELVRVHGVERVRDLPAPVLASVEGGEA